MAVILLPLRILKCLIKISKSTIVIRIGKENFANFDFWKYFEKFTQFTFRNCFIAIYFIDF